MRRFYLMRTHDVSGKSGTGIIAHGVEAVDGTVAVRWCVPGMPRAWQIWDNVNDLITVHDHGGTTDVRWADRHPLLPNPWSNSRERNTA